MGRGGAAPRARVGPPAARVDRLLLLPLVPRHGARVLRGPGRRRAHERALRAGQGRPRGASGRRRPLHGGRPGDDRAGRLAAERLRHPRAGPVLRRDVLPAAAAARAAELASGPARRRRRVGHPPRRDPRAGRTDGPSAGRRRAAAAGRRTAPPGGARRGRPGPARELRQRPRRLGRRAEVPGGVGHRAAAGPRRDDDEPLHAAVDGQRRDLRPGRGRLPPLQHRRDLDGPALREDALRQRAAGPRVRPRLAGLRRPRAPEDGGGDARLGAARDGRRGRRVLQRAGRRHRRRRGADLRVDARRAARDPRPRRATGDRLVRRHRGRQPPRGPAGRQRPGVARPRARRGDPRAHPRAPCWPSAPAGPSPGATTSD